MGTRGEFRVAVTKEDLVFASAHFITFAGHRCETLHGHNYRAGAVIEGGLEPDSWFVLDFKALKQVMKRLTDELDHKVLLPRDNAVTRSVEARPIKGTRPRGPPLRRTRRSRGSSPRAPRTAAANVMIVDLLRNDLGKVSRTGSVRVPQLFALESHPTVHHLVSTVTGVLRDGADPLDLIRAAFPGGSVTGAPKIRALEISAELERAPRGVYCGAIGYLSVTGAMDLNIPIRTLVIRDGAAWFHAGAGIVWDSDPAAEYDETMAKARALIDALTSPRKTSRTRDRARRPASRCR